MHNPGEGQYDVQDNEELTIFDIRKSGESSNIQVQLLGSGACCRIMGVYIGEGNAEGSVSHRVTHQAADTTSEITARIILRDAHALSYTGKIQMDHGVTHAEGQQHAGALILSPGAKLHAQPDLQIAHKHVKCSHGVSVTRLHEEPLFYLMSRGLSRAEAEALLVDAHVQEILSQLPESYV